ncbi:FimV/HubP family polar landmark protein [Shewanella sp. MF05960]|uniref:FimV/HubP family polar landmark protein n=1 Tax=Shewanella sp. MF05960 TaxID=3434874 RepID=UPI003D7ADC9B
MRKRLYRVLFLVFGLCVNAQQALAQVNHVSINSRQSELNQQPRLKLNVVAQNDDLSQLSFYIRQQVDGDMQQQRLSIQPINRFLVQLNGKKLVTDRYAQLVITENQQNKAVLLAVLALFDAPLSFTSAAFIEAQPLPSSSNQPTKAPRPVEADVTNHVAVTVVKNNAVKAVKTNTVSEPVLQPRTSDNCQIVKDNSDTLWRIADRYKEQWNTSVYGAMLAIFEANMLAFSKQKIHLLLKDALLVCPSTEILAQYDNKAVDKKVFEVIEAKHAAR